MPRYIAAIRRRGRDASGLGYLSGHAGVAVALGAAALRRLGPRGVAVNARHRGQEILHLA